MSLLALSVQVYGNPSIAAYIPAGSFYPPPKVDSAVVRVDLYPSPLIPASQISLFFQLAKAGFSQKRKMLRNALSAGMGLPPARIELSGNINSDKKAGEVKVVHCADEEALHT
jgi:16S rRNA (adenine1518-N6/adenine1519-N6)-dimethyltransferase